MVNVRWYVVRCKTLARFGALAAFWSSQPMFAADLRASDTPHVLRQVAQIATQPQGQNDREIVKPLPAAIEQRWISAVKDQPTGDGATVLEALAYAQKLRPRKFTFGEFQSVYNGDGEAVGVAVDFWIGLKRLKTDSYSMLFDIKDVAGSAHVVQPRDDQYGSATYAVLRGRDTFLKWIDDEYTSTCDFEKDREPIC